MGHVEALDRADLHAQIAPHTFVKIDCKDIGAARFSLANTCHHNAVHRAVLGAQQARDALLNIIEEHPPETRRQDCRLLGVLGGDDPLLVLHELAPGHHHADQHGDEPIHDFFEIPTD